MKSKAQTTEIIKLTLKIFIGAVIILFVIAPYIHIFSDKTDRIKVFGFRNLRSFLYVIGLPMSLFLCSTLLFIASKYIEEKFVKSFFTKVSFLFLWSSFFQFIWIFWDRKDLPKSAYYISIIILSVVITLVFKQLLVARKSMLLKLKNAIASLSRFSFIDAKKHIKSDSKDAYNKELLATLKKGME
ncbi:hypothetical protein [Tenacibaculum sp. 190524A02b]|uniref:hypothetical protein n=1 Tax=Tenacibaculum vairaonense TaxID=3137860 RepID=UPI0031FAE80F